MTQAHEQTAARPLRITGKDAFDAEVFLDGQDITSKLRGVHMKVGFDEPAEAMLVLNHRALPSDFDGLARVAIGVEPDPGPAAAKFIAAIDAEMLEQAALNRLDLDPGPQGLTKAMLAQLQEWASGRA